MSPYIIHITLSTGHTRNSPREEVGDDILRLLVPWLNGLTQQPGQRAPLPVPDLAHYSASATVDAGALLATIWGPRGPYLPGRAHDGEADPLVTLGVAQRSRHGGDLWAMMVAQFGVAPGLKRPAEPWCAIALHAGLMAHPQTAEWLGDLERCIAWAWVTRAPQMEAV